MALPSPDVTINFFSFPLVAYTLLGLLIGIIFVLDGWRSLPSENVSLTKSPKIRGLFYILSAGSIPGSASLFDKNTDAIVIYTIVLCTSIIIFLLLYYVYALLVAYKTHRDITPKEPRLSVITTASLTALTIINDGIAAFKRQIDLLVDKHRVKERNRSLDFIIGYYGGLVENSINQNGGVDNYLLFINRYLEVFLKLFLEKEDTLTQYRGAVYYRDKDKGDLRYLAGVAPFDAPHTTDSLPLKGSFAGWVLLSGAHKAYYYSPKNHSNLPFHKRQHESRYNSIIVCRIKAPIETVSKDNEMVLCIDCKADTGTLLTEYMEKMVMSLALSFGHAKEIMNIDYKSINEWVKNQ